MVESVTSDCSDSSMVLTYNVATDSRYSSSRQSTPMCSCGLMSLRTGQSRR